MTTVHPTVLIEPGGDGFSPEILRELTEAYRIVFAAGLNTSRALERLEAAGRCSPEVQFFIDFINRSQRGISK